jgi:hypothetical protein
MSGGVGDNVKSGEAGADDRELVLRFLRSPEQLLPGKGGGLGSVRLVGPGEYCSPCHSTNFRPWSLELNGAQ